MLLRGRGKSRTVHIHLGPHKTGSTAIQRDLRAHRDAIARASGVTPVDAPCIWELARAMNKRRDEDAARLMADVTALVGGTSGDVLISCEDLAGELPGRTGDRKIYPRLWPAVNTLRKAFPKDHVRFYFFLRDPDPWLRSAYVQLLKYRDKFRSFESYLSFLREPDGLWDGIIERTAERMGEDFVVVPYAEGEGFSATAAMLDVVAGPKAVAVLPPVAPRPNSSPPGNIIQLLEVANKSGASRGALQAAKESIWKGTVHAPPGADMGLPGGEAQPDSTAGMMPGRPPAWPPMRNRPDWLSPELEALWTRVNWRAEPQDQPNLMPPLDCDLVAMRMTAVAGEEALPDLGRGRMADQARILKARLSGRPETLYLLGLVISYLRRNTGHEAHARALFQRLWAEEYPALLGLMETRWLISTLQTFLDHGLSEAQRNIGAAGFFLANTLKLYETERALEGLDADAIYPNLVPATRSGFWGLDRFRVGGSDLMLNTLAHLLELAAQDDRAGRVLQELLLRMKRHHTAFSRMDRTRAEHEIDIPPFSDCWSFFEPPRVRK